MFAQPHAEAGRAQMTAILVRAEIAVAQVLGEMNVAEGVASAHGKLVIVEADPPQRLRPFALGAGCVRVMREGEASTDGKIPRPVIKAGVASLSQQRKCR